MILGGARRVALELASLLATGDRGVLATIVRTVGSTYRKTGAQMLIHADGSTVGLLSGGCLEALIAKEALEVLATNDAKVVFYDLMPAEEYLVGYGKGCFGQQWILLEPVTPETPAATRALLAETCDVRRTTGVALVYESEGGGALPVGSRVLVDAAHVVTTNAPSAGADLEAAAAELAVRVADGLETGAAQHGDLITPGGVSRYSLHYAEPAVDLLLFGAGPDALPVCNSAAQLGWDVRIFDHRPAYLREELFPGARSLSRFAPESVGSGVAATPHSAAVIMTHNLIVDGRVLAWAARQEALTYVGLLGPAHRRDRVLALMTEEDGGAAARLLQGRLRAPIGLDLGGEDECAIALAIVAEIQRFRHNATGSPRTVR